MLRVMCVCVFFLDTPDMFYSKCLQESLFNNILLIVGCFGLMTIYPNMVSTRRPSLRHIHTRVQIQNTTKYSKSFGSDELNILKFWKYCKKRKKFKFNSKNNKQLNHNANENKNRFSFND